jgi:hypothetical protein
MSESTAGVRGALTNPFRLGEGERRRSVAVDDLICGDRPVVCHDKADKVERRISSK